MRPLGIALALIALQTAPCHAALVDFVTGTWDHSAVGGSSSNTGWDENYLIGSTTVGGITVTAESIVHGTAVRSGANLAFESIGATTGFNFGNDGTTDTNGAVLTNYQEWRITFSAPIDGLTWDVYDVDEQGSGTRWRDAVAAESWSGAAGAIGSGDAVAWDLTGSELALRSEYVIDHVSRDTDMFGSVNVSTADPEGQGTLTVSTISSVFSLYVFNDGIARGSHNVVNDGSFSFTSAFAPVPEPSSLMLTGFVAFGVFGRRRRGTVKSES